jgi:hypothetical protein
MKKSIQIFRLSLLIATIVMVFSCKKPGDNSQANNPGKTKTELITAGPWKRTALISTPAYDWNANGISDTNVLNIMFPCEKDNFETYYLNGIVETNEGPSKCNSLDPQTWAVTWKLADNETKLVWDGMDEYTLIELTATTLKFQSSFVEGGVTYTHVETYGH